MGLTERVGAATSALRGMSEQAGETRAALEGVSKQAKAAKKNVSSVSKTIDIDLSRATGRLGSLIDTLDAEAARGNTTAEGVLQILTGVHTGVVDANQVVSTFHNTLVPFEGRMQSLGGLLNDLLPKVGQVQGDIRAFVASTRGDADAISQLIEQLERDADGASQAIANITNGILAGRKTIDDLVRSLSALKSQGFGGSAGAIVGEELLGLLTAGTRTGNL